MAWSRVAKGRGRWRLFHNGVDCGDIVVDHPLAALLVDVMVSAANGEPLLNSPDRFVAAGWKSRVEHDEELKAIRIVLASEPVEVRDRVGEAWARLREGVDPNVPLSRVGMGEWVEAVDLIVSTFHAQTVVPDVAA